ncbi:glycosyltransferase family A protein [Turicibacter sanguinis]|uniref:glycosyltransferase family A protein n=1 Tax=Turicibacter sanguinis TaxID=154288 RepID=UPI00189989A1|nr:glycosyltransferase family 2 protein [Turicibacter sanguinis]
MITIFTPTYNRLELLKKLAESLEIQTNKNFNWLIIDDGSEDNTEDWINNYMKESNFEIHYIKQKNQGKHVAFNKAIESCNTEFLINVDSDDFLDENAIQIIYQMITSLDEKDIGCICGKKIGNNHDVKLWKSLNGLSVNILDMKEKYGIVETTIIFKMKYLSKYRFQVFYDDNGRQERFAPEGLLYAQLINEGYFKIFDKCFYFAEYQKDGLTNNIFKTLWCNNFYSVNAALNLKYKVVKNYPLLIKFKTRIKCILNINALCLKKNKNIFKYTPSKILSSLLIIPSYFFMIKRFK